MVIMKWGNTALNIVKDSYIPPLAAPTLAVTNILAGTDNTNPASVVQQCGRGRYQVNFSGTVGAYAEYESLMNDFIDQTARTFVGADGFTMSMTISALSPTGRTLYPLKIEYAITLMEA